MKKEELLERQLGLTGDESIPLPDPTDYLQLRRWVEIHVTEPSLAYDDKRDKDGKPLEKSEKLALTQRQVVIFGEELSAAGYPPDEVAELLRNFARPKKPQKK